MENKSVQNSIDPSVNPYTKAMWNCLQQFDDIVEVPELDDTTSQFLANMIQGRFLQYLVARMCNHYQITESDLEKQLLMTLLTILSDKFFVVFREKVKAKPEIVFIIAKKITTNEISGKVSEHRTDALYHGICKRYFEYQNFGIILRWINTNPEVEKIVFLSQVRKRIQDSSLIKALFYIIQNDEDGIAPTLFNRYLNKNKIERLTNIVKTGEWQMEAEYIAESSAKAITWRKYVAALD